MPKGPARIDPIGNRALGIGYALTRSLAPAGVESVRIRRDRSAGATGGITASL